MTEAIRTVALTTARTELCLITPADIPYLLGLFKRVNLQGETSDAAMHAAILEMLKDYSSIGYAEYLIVDQTTKQPMGLAGYRAIIGAENHANIAVIIDVNHQRKSYGSEALNVLLSAAKPQFNIHMLHAFIECNNLASIQFFTRHEFVASGEHSISLSPLHLHYQRACT